MFWNVDDIALLGEGYKFFFNSRYRSLIPNWGVDICPRIDVTHLAALMGELWSLFFYCTTGFLEGLWPLWKAKGLKLSNIWISQLKYLLFNTQYVGLGF